jgi:hypothetical protein
MASPTVSLWDVTSGGQINIPLQVGGVWATQVGGNPLDFGPMEAGMWSKPKVFLFQFQGGTASQLDLRLYDTDQNVESPIITTQNENLFASYTPNAPTLNTQWNFRLDLKSTWVDPQSISLDPANSPIDSWREMRYGPNPIRLDDYVPQPGNDGRSGAGSLLTTSVNGDTTKHFTNFFLYMSIKPRTAATPGEHLGWGLQLNFVYP